MYTVAAVSPTRPGKHALTMTVQAYDVTDLLDATLEVGPASGAAPGSPPGARVSGTSVVWSGAVVLALAALGFIARRRRRAARQSAPLTKAHRCNANRT
ncbi:MAG: hypothetical protein IPO19_11960 [Rhodoferax sp.]|nr:hypothetical protein [Rhodoferax sp.]